MRVARFKRVLVVAALLALTPGAVAAQTRVTGRFRSAVAQYEGYAYAVFRVEAVGGKLTVDLTSETVDTYLLLRSPDGVITGDDDGGDERGNSRIEVQNAAAGDWMVIATTFDDGDEGDFSLSVAGASRVIVGTAPATVIAAAFATRGTTNRAAERARSLALLKEQLSLSEFRTQLLQKLRAAIAQSPASDEADRKEFQQLEARERELNAALASVASLASRQLLEELVRGKLRETQSSLSSVSSRLNGRAATREAYMIAVSELEQLTQAATELNRLQTLILSSQITPDQLLALRTQIAQAQAAVNALIESVAAKLLDSRFVQELTFAFLGDRNPESLRQVLLGGILGAQVGRPVRIERGSGALGSFSRMMGGAFGGASAPRSLPTTDPSVWLPALFPWPPPESSSRVVIGRDELIRAGGRVETLGDVDDALSSALKRAGYSGYSYWGVRDGFALVTPIEQTDAAGAPLNGVARWSTRVAEMKNFTVAEYLRALLTAPPGYFRVIVFIVTPHSFTSRAERAFFSVVEHWARAGHAFLPNDVRGLAFTADHQLTALVYEFRKAKNTDRPVTSIPGRHTANAHLVRTGVLSQR